MVKEYYSGRLLTQTKKGFTLLEILVSVTILSIVLISSLQIVVFSIRNLIVEQHKIYASYFSEELVEWLETEREIEWLEFTAKASDSGTTYCVNNEITITSTFDTALTPLANCTGNGIIGSDVTIPKIFDRTVKLTSVGNPITLVQVEVITNWTDLGQQHNVPINTYYTLHE